MFVFAVLQVICERGDVYASACAVARALPLYSAKSQQTQTKRNITVEFVLVGPDSDPTLADDDIQCLDTAAHAVRLAAKIVDMPCANMNTNAFVAVSMHLRIILVANLFVDGFKMSFLIIFGVVVIQWSKCPSEKLLFFTVIIIIYLYVYIFLIIVIFLELQCKERYGGLLRFAFLRQP